jgi:hypothetical protein
VRQVADAHGAEVAVEEAPGGGALFRLTLPWRAVDDDDAPAGNGVGTGDGAAAARR